VRYPRAPCVADAGMSSSVPTVSRIGSSMSFAFAIARHAVVDLSYSYHVQPLEPSQDRLPREDLGELLKQLRAAGLEPAVDDATVDERLRHTRALYESYVCALARRLELALPRWLAPESPSDNWRNTEWH